jgi:hypothetical protein
LALGNGVAACGGGARLDLDEGDHAAEPHDQVDLALRRAPAPGQHFGAALLIPARRRVLGRQPGAVRAGAAARSAGHAPSPLSASARR